MGLWQIFDADGVAQPEQFDDGLAFMPGEDGFSSSEVSARAKKLGKGFTFSLIGVPNWHSRVEAEAAIIAEAEDAARLKASQAAQELAEKAAQKQAQEAAAADRAAAEAELDAMLDPSSLQRRQINAKFDAMLAALPNRSKDIEGLRNAALAELDG